MKLCMGMIEESLRETVLSGGSENTFSEMNLARWTLRPWEKGKGKENTLYVLPAEAVPEKKIPAGSALILSGSFKEEPEGCWLCSSLPFPELAEKVREVFDSYGALEKELYEAACIRHSIEDLSLCAAPFFSGELLVLSPDFRSYSRNAEDAFFARTGLAAPGADGSLDPAAITALNSDPDWTGSWRETGVFLYESDILKTDLLCVNVFCRAVPVCRVLTPAVRERRRCFDEKLLQWFAHFAEIACEISDTAELPGDRLEDAVRALLGEREVSGETLEMALQFRGWRLDGPFLIACLMPCDSETAEPGQNFACRMLARELRDTFVMMEEGQIFCLSYLKYYGGTAAGFMERNVEFLRDSHILGGFSNEFTVLSELPARWKQAGTALSEGLRNDPTIWYHHFRSQVLSYLLDRMKSELPGEFLAAPAVLTLRDYDRKNGTEYGKTLKTYLDTGMNAVESAGKLFISRGTMIYRMNRIAELTGIDLRKPDTRLYIELSFRLLGSL